MAGGGQEIADAFKGNHQGRRIDQGVALQRVGIPDGLVDDNTHLAVHVVHRAEKGDRTGFQLQMPGQPVGGGQAQPFGAQGFTQRFEIHGFLIGYGDEKVAFALVVADEEIFCLLAGQVGD
ncbi:hypothetical protein DESC_610108 [Desulfosarcina cetonica]|nr:hypothetical protein DESC_610108 [Desulfosarcina cetonica]